MQLMESGLESSAEAVDMSDSEESRPNTPATVVRDGINDDSISDASIHTTDQKKVGGRNLISKIKEKRDSKLTKKLSMENQLLALGKEELSLKIKWMNPRANIRKQSMGTSANSLSPLRATINGGFAMLGNILQQPSQAANWQAPPHLMHNSQRCQSSSFMASSYMPSNNTDMYFGDSNQYPQKP